MYSSSNTSCMLWQLLTKQEPCCCRVPVSLDMVEEYDSFCKDFRRCVHENQDQGNLDLGEHLVHNMVYSMICRT